jgi:hypothetical protein
MVVQKFTSADAMVKYLKGLTPSDHFKIAKSVGIQPKDKADAHLYADYIVQGTSKGLSGASLVQYAEANVARLQGIMPHLKEKHQVASVAKPTVRKVKASKKPSVAKPAKPKTVKVKYEDYTIVARPDRGGFEGWYGGKAEAFRTTKEKVENFFFKKYSRLGPFKTVN